MWFKALYTKHVVQKHKKWQDGYVLVEGDRLVLHDEERTSINTARKPRNATLTPDSDETLACFEGLLVQLDGALPETEPPGRLAPAPTAPVQQAPSQAASSAAKGFRTRPVTLQTQGQGPAQQSTGPKVSGGKGWQPPRKSAGITGGPNQSITDTANAQQQQLWHQQVCHTDPWANRRTPQPRLLTSQQQAPEPWAKGPATHQLQPSCSSWGRLTNTSASPTPATLPHTSGPEQSSSRALPQATGTLPPVSPWAKQGWDGAARAPLQPVNGQRHPHQVAAAPAEAKTQPSTGQQGEDGQGYPDLLAWMFGAPTPALYTSPQPTTGVPSQLQAAAAQSPHLAADQQHSAERAAVPAARSHQPQPAGASPAGWGRGGGCGSADRLRAQGSWGGAGGILALQSDGFGAEQDGLDAGGAGRSPAAHFGTAALSAREDGPDSGITTRQQAQVGRFMTGDVMVAGGQEVCGRRVSAPGGPRRGWRSLAGQTEDQEVGGQQASVGGARGEWRSLMVQTEDSKGDADGVRMQSEDRVGRGWGGLLGAGSHGWAQEDADSRQAQADAAATVQDAAPGCWGHRTAAALEPAAPTHVVDTDVSAVPGAAWGQSRHKAQPGYDLGRQGQDAPDQPPDASLGQSDWVPPRQPGASGLTVSVDTKRPPGPGMTLPVSKALQTGFNAPRPASGTQTVQAVAAAQQPASVSDTGGAAGSGGRQSSSRPAPGLTHASGVSQQAGGKQMMVHLSAASSRQALAGLLFPPVHTSPQQPTAPAAAGSAGRVGAGSTLPVAQRLVAIPTTFSGPGEHLQALQAALAEEVNLRVAEAAQPLVAAMHAAAGGGTAGSTGPGSRPAAGAAGQPSAALAAAIEQACARSHVPYFACAQLAVKRPFQPHQGSGGRGRQGGKGRGGTAGKRWRSKGRGADTGSDEDTGAGDDTAGVGVSADKEEDQYYLSVPQARSRIKEFRRFDLWFLSPHPLIHPATQPTPSARSGGAPVVRQAARRAGGGAEFMAVRSLWHAPDREGRMRVEFVTPTPHNLPKQQSVYVWRGPDVSSELHVIQALAAAATHPAAHTAGQPQLGPVPAPSAHPAAQLHSHLTRLLLPTYTLWDVCPAAAAAAATAKGAGRGKTQEFKRPGKKQLLAASNVKQPAAANQTAWDSVGPGGGHPLAAESGLAQNTTYRGDLPAPPDELHAGVGVDEEGVDAGTGAGRQRKRKGKRKAVAESVGSLEDAIGVVDDLVVGMVEQFRLNSDQEAVLSHVASWLKPTIQQAGQCAGEADQATGCACPPTGPPVVQSPVCLVHGPFGSGKSTLLAAVIMLLVAAREKLSQLDPQRGATLGAHCRVLVAANTNVAVDRVLISLQERGFTSFLRVGSLPRMARAVLPHSLHAADDSKDAATQLKAMIAAEPDELQKKLLSGELAAVQAGAERQRKKALANTPVVGTTCAALLQSELWQQAGEFPVVVLDESSQMTEPSSVVAVLKAKASFLIAAGDPMQLPPVIANPSQLTTQPGSCMDPSAGPTSADGLLRPLFVRLQHLGHSAHLLRTQYRCHPAISQVPNEMFYNGALRDGCSAADRCALVYTTGGHGKTGLHVQDDEAECINVWMSDGQEDAPCGPPLPALCFCNIIGGAAAMDPRTKSSYNMTEARCVADLVAALQWAGVEPCEIGVICMYKAQVDKIKGLLAQQPATVTTQPARGRQQQERRRERLATTRTDAAPAQRHSAREATLGPDQQSARKQARSNAGPAGVSPSALEDSDCDNPSQPEGPRRKRTKAAARSQRVLVGSMSESESGGDNRGCAGRGGGKRRVHRHGGTGTDGADGMAGVADGGGLECEDSEEGGGTEEEESDSGREPGGWCDEEALEGSEEGSEGKSEGAEREEGKGRGRQRKDETQTVQVATVDSFQGAEKEVIILATTVTRTSTGSGGTTGGFAGDSMRLNVALTRARRHLIVVGSDGVLSSTAPAYQRLVSLCKRASREAGATPGSGRPTATKDRTNEILPEPLVSAAFFQSPPLLLQCIGWPGHGEETAVDVGGGARAQTVLPYANGTARQPWQGGALEPHRDQVVPQEQQARPRQQLPPTRAGWAQPQVQGQQRNQPLWQHQQLVPDTQATYTSQHHPQGHHQWQPSLAGGHQMQQPWHPQAAQGWCPPQPPAQTAQGRHAQPPEPWRNTSSGGQQPQQPRQPQQPQPSWVAPSYSHTIPHPDTSSKWLQNSQPELP